MRQDEAANVPPCLAQVWYIVGTVEAPLIYTGPSEDSSSGEWTLQSGT